MQYFAATVLQEPFLLQNSKLVPGEEHTVHEEQLDYIRLSFYIKIVSAFRLLKKPVVVSVKQKKNVIFNTEIVVAIIV